MTFEFDPNSSYTMPAHFGPRPMHPKMTGWYHDVTAMTLSYVTDRQVLAQYVPAPFRVTDEAVVTIVYAKNRQVDWLAGHGYNLVGVSASVHFDGENDSIAGQFALVMWENLTDPILTGRELQGVPKLYADIEEHTVVAGEWSTKVGHFGTSFLSLGASDLRDPTTEEIAAAADADPGTSMGWRHLPGISGFGTTTSEPTAFPSKNEISWVQVGTGSVQWSEVTWEQNPTQFHIVNALAALPILEQRPAVVSRGSTNLILLDDLPRAIS
jgi:acetoacetate decarboxylase